MALPISSIHWRVSENLTKTFSKKKALAFNRDRCLPSSALFAVDSLPLEEKLKKNVFSQQDVLLQPEKELL
jgi:hypothetical protein